MGKLIAGNWKMNNNLGSVSEFVKYIKKNGKNQKDLLICPPATMITELAKNSKGLFEVGAQNCHFAEKGAYTGEISANMIKETGATYVIIGHSERREYFGEGGELLNKKILAALGAGLKVIYCIGEKLEDKAKYKSILKNQIKSELKKLPSFENLTVAYEPIWAIGTGKVATTDDILKVHTFIKQTFKELFDVDIKVLYGGSVKSSNSAEILGLDQVDGVLIGGASLKPDEFIKIAESRG